MKRLGILVLLAAGALTLSACNPTEGGKDKAGAAARACRSQDLTLKRGADDPLVSTVDYRFTNHGAASCSLKGYPSITLTGPDGAALDANIQRFAPPPTPSRRAPNLVLRPGATADFTVAFPKDAGKGACKPYVKLTASPPGSDWGLDVAEDAKLCPGTLLVSTFTIDPADL
jgi:predicted small secreted protein